MTRRTVLTAALPLTLLAAESAAEKEVMAAMQALRSAMLASDAAALNKLLHRDLLYAHSNGLTETKAEAVEAISKKLKYLSIDYGKLSVRTYPTTALVKGGVVIKAGTAETVPSNLDVLFVWLKEPSGWQLVARQAAKLIP